MAASQQWLAMLNNLQNVRREEKERSGIIDHLAKHHVPAEPIQVERLMDFIGKKLCSCHPIIQSDWERAFRPSLEVKNMTDQLPKRLEAKAKRFVEKAQACYQHPSIGYWIVRTGYEDLATVAPNWIVLDHKGKLVLRLSLQNAQSLSQLGQYNTLLFTNAFAAEPQESTFLSRIRNFFTEF